MTEQEARDFVQRLAVPNRSAPPPCPLCHARHQLEHRCAERASRGPSALPVGGLAGAARR